MNISDMKATTQLARNIDLHIGKVADLKTELADCIVSGMNTEAKDFAKEIDKAIDKTQAEVAAEYEIIHQEPRNFWLGIKSIVRVKYIAKVEPDMMVDQKVKGKTVQEPISQVAEKGLKAMTTAGASINKQLGNTDGRSGKRAPQTPKAAPQNASGSKDAGTVNVGGVKANWLYSIEQAAQKGSLAELAAALVERWADIEKGMFKEGYRVELHKRDVTTEREEHQAEQRAKVMDKIKGRKGFRSIQAIEHKPAKGKKHQPQPLH